MRAERASRNELRLVDAVNVVPTKISLSNKMLEALCYFLFHDTSCYIYKMYVFSLSRAIITARSINIA